MKISGLTKLEKKVMDTLWDSESPMSASQIHEALPTLSVYSIRQVIQKLLQMKYIMIAGYEENKKAIMRVYAPTVSQADYVLSFLSKRTTFDLISNLVKESDDLESLTALQNEIEAKIAKLKESK